MSAVVAAIRLSPMAVSVDVHWRTSSWNDVSARPRLAVVESEITCCVHTVVEGQLASARNFLGVLTPCQPRGQCFERTHNPPRRIGRKDI